jgi:hypothetical protein
VPVVSESVPVEAAVEVRCVAEGLSLLSPAEIDLVECLAAVGAVRPIAVVPGDEVAAEAIQLAEAGDEPDETEDGLLEGPVDPLDAGGARRAASRIAKNSAMRSPRARQRAAMARSKMSARC